MDSESVSMTTRLPRNKEVDGVDYFFVSNEEFDRNLENDNFLEWANFEWAYPLRLSESCLVQRGMVKGEGL